MSTDHVVVRGADGFEVSVLEHSSTFDIYLDEGGNSEALKLLDSLTNEQLTSLGLNLLAVASYSDSSVEGLMRDRFDLSVDIVEL